MVDLRPYQTPAVEWLSRQRRALVKAPAGSGKTWIAAAALQRVVNRKPRPEPVRIGWIAGTVEMRDQGIEALKLFPMQATAKVVCVQGCPDMSDRDVLIVDEAQHAGSELWSSVINSCPGAVWGFSATPWDTPEQQAVIMSIFQQMYEIPRSAMGDKLAHGRVRLLSDTDSGLREPIAKQIREDLKAMAKKCFFFEQKRLMAQYWAEFSNGAPIEEANKLNVKIRGQLRDFLMEKLADELYPRVAPKVCRELGIRLNEKRNRAIVRTALAHRSDYVLVLVYQKEHGYALQEQIPGSVVLHSKVPKKKRAEHVEAFRRGEVRCMIGTSLFDEGFDCPRANILIMACGGKAAGRTEQRAGRVMRSFAGKQEGLVYDFEDQWYPMAANHARDRQATYRRLGYTIEDAQQKALL